MGSDSDGGISFPNYQALANAHNIDYLKISLNNDIKETIRKVLSNNRPNICELMIDTEQEQMPKAINRRTLEGKTIPTTFEDMYPFLSRKEFKRNNYENFKK